MCLNYPESKPWNYYPKQKMTSPIVYTVTVIDLYSDPTVGVRRTPVIYLELGDAVYAVKNNLGNMSDGITFQYAVIEETRLNVVRPQIDYPQQSWWFKYNSAMDEFVSCAVPTQLRNQSGFGIG